MPAGTRRTPTVLRRFQDVFAAIPDPRAQATVSIGAPQAVEDLGKSLKRDADWIEFRTILEADDVYRLRPVVVDPGYVGRVAALRTKRQSGWAALQSLEGTLTAIDLGTLSLKLALPDSRTTVRGNFSALLRYPLARAVGLKVRLKGQVEYRGKRPYFIQAQHFELLDEPE